MKTVTYVLGTFVTLVPGPNIGAVTGSSSLRDELPEFRRNVWE
jgi:hypothetical protein